jgi:hypothetical protein
MGFLDGFPFVNRDERRRREKEFDSLVFPLGVDDQRKAAVKLLSDLIPPDGPNKPNILLFAFIVAKEAYVINEKGESGLAAARRELDRALRKDKREKDLILAAVVLDAEATSLDDYPTAEQVISSLK